MMSGFERESLAAEAKLKVEREKKKPSKLRNTKQEPSHNTWLLDSLKPRLMHSRAAVGIPLYDCIIFVGALNGAELVCWFSKIAQTFDAITGGSVPGREPRVERATAFGLDPRQHFSARDKGGWGALRSFGISLSVWIIFPILVSYSYS